jgi:hypothetical protein
MFKKLLLLVAAVATGLGLAVLAQPEASFAPASVPPPAETVTAVPVPEARPAVAIAPPAEKLMPVTETPTTSSATAVSVHERLAALLQAGESPALEGFGREAIDAEDEALLAELEAALLAEFEGS